MTTYPLKDGSTVTDPRLGRIILFDDRSKNYPVVRSLTSAQQIPRNYVWDCTTWLDQGQGGGCSFHAISHDFAAFPVAIPGLTHDYAQQGYYDAQILDPFPGGEWPGAVPQVQGTTTIAAMTVAVNRGAYTGYSWAMSEEQLALAVGWKGPAIIGINWTNDMFNPNKFGFVSPTGGIAGGHCILVRGVSISRGYYILRNSWGRGFGINGDCFITRADMKTLLSQQGEACIPEGRKMITIK